MFMCWEESLAQTQISKAMIKTNLDGSLKATEHRKKEVIPLLFQT